MVASARQPLLGQSQTISVWMRQDAKVKTTTAGLQLRLSIKALPLLLMFVLFTTFYYIDEDFIRIPSFQLQFRANGSFAKIGSPNFDGQCRIPNIDPFHPAILQMLTHQDHADCNYKPITKTVYDSKTDLYRLEIMTDQLKSYKLSNNQRNSLSCCFYPIIPNDKTDGGYKTSKDVCTKFQENITISYQTEIILVDCTIKNRKKRKSIYQNVHSTATKQQKISKKIKDFRNQNVTSNANSSFSVHLLGIDSVSYAHFQRQMSATLKYLRNNNWIEYRGYNKVGENTLPNLMPILTGYSLPQIEKTCWHGRSDYFDSCPFLWKNFSAHNYVTMYAEDEVKISSFNYVKKGFKHEPTDYYARAYMRSATFSLKSKMANGLYYCLGPTTSVNRVLEYSLDFFRQMNETRFFSLAWMNSMSHNSLDMVHSMDEIMVNYFNTLAKLGTLNDTVIVFFSDHGIRFGKFRQTFFGWFEERLPFIFFHIPNRFRELYPEQVRQLENNADKLTTPYEVHLTLHKVLNMSAEVTAQGCPKCKSLFEPADGNRSCSDASIPFDWCVCGEFIPLSTKGPEATTVGMTLVNEINRITDGKSDDSNKKCAKFKLMQVMSVRKIVNSDSKTDVAFQIIVKTTPGKAVFEATVLYSPSVKVLGSISRLDSYGRDGDCTDTAWMRKYCYCVSNNS